MSDFTKGKWHYDDILDEVISENGIKIAAIFFRDDNYMDDDEVEAEMKANARVIVNAPEMYDELLYFVEALKRYSNNPHDEELPDWRDAEKLLARINRKGEWE